MQSREIVDSINRSSVKSWRFDARLSFEPIFWDNSSLTLGYATGKGSRASQSSGTGTFRQTGLQDNSTPYAYYGSILEPELSNLDRLQILIQSGLTITLDFGLSPYPSNSSFLDSNSPVPAYC